MKIYVSHSSGFDYHNELYKPLRNSDLNKEYNIILPHEKSSKQFNSKEELKSCQIVIAEVSESSVGVGIELGWADLYGDKIICVYKKGSVISSSLSVVSKTFISYSNSEDLIDKLRTTLHDIAV